MNSQNPFLSSIFKKIWLRHFNTENRAVKSFDTISELEFINHPKLPLFINIGKTHTKGVGYSVNTKSGIDLKNNTLLIFDVPTYFNIDTSDISANIGFYKSKQYPGFLIETSRFNSLNDYMLANFSKNSRNKNNKYKRRLESSFSVDYRMFFGEISKEEYNTIFEAFKALLEKRFDDKQVTNNNLDAKEWEFYNEVAYPLILEKKASLFVVYDNSKVIGVTLCYLSEDILFDAITVFDIDYFKFHLGSVTIMKLIEWCIQNNIKTFDFSKGYFDYKTRWCTVAYDFEYHLYYDATSFKSRILAASLKRFYDFKQMLREKNVNERLHKFRYKLRNKENSKAVKFNYKFTEIEEDANYTNKSIVDFELNENKHLKLLIFEFLYLHEEHYNAVKLYKLTNDSKYLIEAENKSIIATIEKLDNKNTNQILS